MLIAEAERNGEPAPNDDDRAGRVGEPADMLDCWSWRSKESIN
jgi:hypothetical protein